MTDQLPPWLPPWLPPEARQVHTDLEAYVETLDLIEVNSFSVCVLANLVRVHTIPEVLAPLLGDIRRQHTSFLLLVLAALQRRSHKLNDIAPSHRDCSAFMAALNSMEERIRATPPRHQGRW
jgi:hypothetical protein